tara:strand:+ start:532 stop:849 length:318 start_codon:yes stop_codon:yes gene_type:complete
MTYTINGKQYTENDINLAVVKIETAELDNNKEFDRFISKIMKANPLNYCDDPSATWPIIEKCWDKLNESILRSGGQRKSYWQEIMNIHKCTKLIAACICLIELNE